MDLKLLSRNRCFQGIQERYEHWSETTNCSMTFSVFLPPQTQTGKDVPYILWLSGLTCNDENFVQKAGAQQYAAKLGLALIMPDTSPRGDNVPDDSEQHWDFGKGAGFYINATQQPWAKHYQMFDYVNNELQHIVESHFPCTNKKSICGHSMGGHGAFVSALRQPNKYQSVSALAPIVNPSQCPWGEKAFQYYLGPNKDAWKLYDTCELIKDNGLGMPGLIDQGQADNFLKEQLQTEHLIEIVNHQQLNITISYQEGYDHSYFFVASFIEKHLQFHAEFLECQ